jgi:hypothetical protein
MFIADNDRQRAILERLEWEMVAGIEHHLLETLDSLSEAENDPE